MTKITGIRMNRDTSCLKLSRAFLLSTREVLQEERSGMLCFNKGHMNTEAD